MLKINNASKLFGENKIFENLSLEINKETIVGLAGPSGSGKSTLLRCIQKLEILDKGAIAFDGSSGFMFQDFQLFPHMNIFQNLTYAPNLKGKKEENEEKAWQLLKTLKIDHKALDYPKNLSGGQKQRAALARSLMISPSFLLCDEPTSGLDVATILDVIDLLKSVRDMGVTMIIASHDLDFLTKLADRIIVINQGKIVADINPNAESDPINFLKQYY